MKFLAKNKIAVFVTFLILIWFSYPYLLNFLPPKGFSAVESVEVELISAVKGPEYRSEVLFSHRFEDDEKVALLSDLFIKNGKPIQEHKCASLGVFKFISGEKVSEIEILPGHDSNYYEFRYDGRIFKLKRALYIQTLELVGIPIEAIVLDGHPQ